MRNACTQLLRIGPEPLAGAPAIASSKVDSLNVSVAAGVLLHHLLHCQGRAVASAEGLASNGTGQDYVTELAGMATEKLGAVA